MNELSSSPREGIMSDNELDELLSQLKDSCKKHRHVPSNETNLHNLLKRIDVFINRRHMKLLSHQKRLDDLQRDLLFSESESSKTRVALEKKDFEVNQLHRMLDKAEQTTHEMMSKYDHEVQKLSKQLCNVQHEYERLKTLHKHNQPIKGTHEILSELARLRERNKMLETDNQRLNQEIDQLKRTKCATPEQVEVSSREKDVDLERLSQSCQRSNPLASKLLSKMQTLENEIDFYKRRTNQQETEIRRLEKTLNHERVQHRSALETGRSNPPSEELEKLRALCNQSEQQSHLLRLELQRVRAEKEILKVQFIEEKMMDSASSECKSVKSNDYEKFIRNELEINIDEANKLINYWNHHQRGLEEKIRQLTRELNQSTKERKSHNVNDLSAQLSQYNETILHAKRDMNQLQMELTDKNTVIYNLYKKIECLEQALMISKQRMNSQVKEIEELRSRHETTSASLNREHAPMMIDGLSTDDEGPRHRSMGPKTDLRTSSPIKSASIHKHFEQFDAINGYRKSTF